MQYLPMSIFKKYRYLGIVSPEVPVTWEPLILEMLVSIEKLVKPRHYPRFVLNFFADRHEYILEQKAYFSQIKQKFGSLRVYGQYIPEVQKIIDSAELLCNNTCEFCGRQGTSHIMVKGWVRNLCGTCKEEKKNGINI